MTLMFTPAGVCFNCLNGLHEGCEGCKCEERKHRQWWFRADGITDEAEALERQFSDYDGLVCTCRVDCLRPCKGGCGCDACSSAYGDFLSLE